jgi:hypothetical protein
MLGNRNSPIEYNKCVFKYCFSAILNFASSFIRLLRLAGRLLKILMPE